MTPIFMVPEPDPEFCEDDEAQPDAAKAAAASTARPGLSPTMNARIGNLHYQNAAQCPGSQKAGHAMSQVPPGRAFSVGRQGRDRVSGLPAGGYDSNDYRWFGQPAEPISGCRAVT